MFLSSYCQFLNDSFKTKLCRTQDQTCLINQLMKILPSSRCYLKVFEINHLRFEIKLISLSNWQWKKSKYSQTCLNDHLWTTATCQKRPVWVINDQSKSQFYQTPLSNGHFFQVQRAAVVHRFDCSLNFKSTLLSK